LLNDLWVKAVVFTSTEPTQGGGMTKTTEQSVPLHGGAEGEDSAPKSAPACLHPQRAVIQMIAEIFNTCLQGETFTCKVFVISRLWSKMHAVKAEKRKLAVCA
jgi:hypothetical protein